MKPKNSTVVLLPLVFISGASALIYQVVWHRYLALLFGAQATATSLCLAVFLGGMGVGYLCFGKWSYRRGPGLVRLFCFMEFGLATWAILFPTIFRAVSAAAGGFSAVLGPFYLLGDFLLASLLLGPPTFLMGGTLPVLTQALSRNLAKSSRVHAQIYGWNTLGAFLGALVCGYLLLPNYSYPLVLTIGAIGNLLVALTVWLVYGDSGRHAPVVDPSAPLFPPLARHQYPILVTAFCSGFYIFSLQAILVRLLGLAAGASYYNFSLVVAIFIFCLGIGSLGIKEGRRKHRRLYWNQIAVIVGFLAVFATLNYWSYAAHFIRVSLQSFPSSFYVYQFLLALVLFAALFLPLWFAGRTMPLSFHLIRDDAQTLGVRVGQLYAWNTIGSIAGAIVGGYLLLLVFNLEGVVRIAILTAAFSATILVWNSREAGPRQRLLLLVLPLTLSIIAFGMPGLKHERLLQAFRRQIAMETSFSGAEEFGKYLGRSAKLLLWKDGPSGTLGIGAFPRTGEETSRTLFVNGKSDGNTGGDRLTTLLLGQIPGVLGQKVEKAFIVGFGTGMTVAALADFEEVKHIDVAEISESLVKNAQMFDGYNGAITQNPKVKIHQVDGFRYLNHTPETYDVVISEPSNPWTAGVENVYTQEFYQAARQRLSPDGLMVQWINTYAFSHDLMRTVFKTITSVFPVVRVFQLHTGDIALVGSARDFTNEDYPRFEKRFKEPKAFHALSVLGIDRLETFLALEIIPPSAVTAIGAGGELHRAENPRLSFHAAQALFAGWQADVQKLRQDYKEYYTSVKDSLLVRRLGGQPPDLNLLGYLKNSFCLHEVGRGTGLCEQTQVALFSQTQDDRYLSTIGFADQLKADITEIRGEGNHLRAARGADTLAQSPLYLDAVKRYYSPIFMPSREAMLSGVDACIAKETREGRSTALGGECLIRRLAYLEAFAVGNQELIDTGALYLKWFRNFDKNSPDYSRFLAASETLSRLLMLLS